MAIAFDFANNSGYQAASGSYSWSHTCSGVNRILIVSIALLNVANDVATLTYAGAAMTRLRSDVDGTGTIRTDIYYLLAPATGANNVAITLNSASVSAAMSSSYKGVSQYTPIDAQNGTTGTTGAGGGSASLSTTVVTEGAWLIDAVATTDTSITVGAGQNQRSNVTGAVGSGGQSDRSALPAGAQTMQWDAIGALLNWTMSSFAILPATIQGTTTSTSSTSSTSSSTSSTSTSTTSVSTSSTSSSVSTSSISTSSTSSSTSTSSTSSSISSTSSSTSSTSLSSTSSSTSISSTSSSISSTSLSSTSTSSTSSSTSVSSISTSFSSTSSSVSSTSASTSSTSFSSTSSSSSTSSTTYPPPNIDYTYQDSLTLPTTAADLINRFTTSQVSDVAGDDEDYFIEYGSEEMIRNYQRQGTDNTSTPQFTWRGRTTYDTRISPMLIQIFNVNSTAWETLAVANQVPPDTDFSVTVKQTTNISNYYDSTNTVTFRSYQQVI